MPAGRGAILRAMSDALGFPLTGALERVLDDLDRLMAGVTHWQHPRFFAYFATTASPPGINTRLSLVERHSRCCFPRTVASMLDAPRSVPHGRLAA